MNNEHDFTTQPTATAILDRLQTFETRLVQKIDTLANRVEGQMISLKDEIKKSIELLGTKIELLNDDTLTVRAGLREMRKRINDLEAKGS